MNWIRILARIWLAYEAAPKKKILAIIAPMLLVGIAFAIVTPNDGCSNQYSFKDMNGFSKLYHAPSQILGFAKLSQGYCIADMEKHIPEYQGSRQKDNIELALYMFKKNQIPAVKAEGYYYNGTKMVYHAWIQYYNSTQRSWIDTEKEYQGHPLVITRRTR